MKSKIIIDSVSKSFGDKLILDKVNLNIEESDSIAILGGSGTGKSVLVKILCGLLDQDSGNIIIDGQNTSEITLRKRSKILDQIGFLFQNGALFDSLKVWENIAFKLLYKNKIDHKKAMEMAIETLKIVGLNESVKDLNVYELSGGMRKRVSLARTIIYNPKIIIFDEPTTGLDPIMSEVINDLILKCSNLLKATTITITHDIKSAKKIANKIFFLYKGKFVWNGSRDDMMSNDDPYINQFVNGFLDGPVKFN